MKLASVLVLCQDASAYGYDWSSLSDGLNAWEFFNFDKDFTYEVSAHGKALFRYPKGVPDVLLLANETATPTIKITGTKNDFLKKVTTPHVEAILRYQKPGATS